MFLLLLASAFMCLGWLGVLIAFIGYNIAYFTLTEGETSFATRFVLCMGVMFGVAVLKGVL